jgi:hypothetical protein
MIGREPRYVQGGTGEVELSRYHVPVEVLPLRRVAWARCIRVDHHLVTKSCVLHTDYVDNICM